MDTEKKYMLFVNVVFGKEFTKGINNFRDFSKKFLSQIYKNPDERLENFIEGINQKIDRVKNYNENQKRCCVQLLNENLSYFNKKEKNDAIFNIEKNLQYCLAIIS
jgi:primosomal protein N''